MERLISATALKETLVETLEKIRQNPKMDGQEMHIIAACHALSQMIDDAPALVFGDNDLSLKLLDDYERGKLFEYQSLGYTIDHLRKLVQAEKDGRLVVLPCKVGDTIYMPIGRFRITGYEEDQCDGFHVARDGILQIKAQCYAGNHGTYGIPGKTVFLTREEAKAALEAQKGGGER